VKLLLDEHLSPQIAESLRSRGHDVVAVVERPELRGRPDIDVLVAAAAERRVVVSEDIRDFARLGLSWLPSRKPHFGTILVSRRSFPRHPAAYGRLVRALEALLAAHPGDDDLVGDVIWLRRAAPDAD
jgi:predicted nuclease of predicted toxin-antitoxin system